MKRSDGTGGTVRGPERVRAHLTDGRVLPVEVVYDHTGPDGVAIWKNVHPVPGSVREVTADVMPPMTAISIEVPW